MIIRPETPADWEEIDEIEREAFGGEIEAALVRTLRHDGHLFLSLVAEEGRLAGHCAFSRMFIDAADHSVPAIALAPVAVLPEYQRRGIGSALIRHGLDQLRTAGESIVIVVGEPEFYRRFGFTCDAVRKLESGFPQEFFMALELAPGALSGIHGPVRYAPAFGLSS